MACFLVSTAEAVAVHALEKHAEKVEAQEVAEQEGTEKNAEFAVTKIPFSRKLKWLSNLLWGGAILLLFEHVWHGEVVPWFPFLTAMSDASDTAEMLHEMATVGVGMAVLITAVWGIMCVVADVIVKREPQAATVKQQ